MLRDSREDSHVVSVGLRGELEARVHLNGADLELVGRQRLAVRIEHIVAQGNSDLARPRSGGTVKQGSERRYLSRVIRRNGFCAVDFF